MKVSSPELHAPFTPSGVSSPEDTASPLQGPSLLDAATGLRLTRTHRRLGMLATVPIVGWILSSFGLHGVGLALPNGLQGVYELEPYHAAEMHLEESAAVAPSTILESLASDGVERIYWLRLEALGAIPAYVIKPGPYDVERVYDARTGERLDPLTDDVLRAVADEQLVGTSVAEVHDGDEFNRYYTQTPVPAVAMTMEGDQPSELVFSRASGRILRRTDPLAHWFHTAYLSVHVWQWGDALRVFTGLLYGLVGVALVLVGLGYVLWWTRRHQRRRWTGAVRRSRRLHARFAPVAGFLLATQMLVGAYLWFNLGLIEPRFRGQGSFDPDWSGGIETTETLAAASDIAAALPPGTASDRPVQRYEWRAVGSERFWLAYPDRNADGVLLDASSGDALERLSPEQAAIAGAQVVLGEAVAEGVESQEYWMDYNARIPTYRFRFADPDATDVHVSQTTGEIVQRRPAIWRAFGPFLAYHTFGFTGNPWFDTVLLTALQLIVLAMVVTGWGMILRPRRPAAKNSAA